MRRQVGKFVEADGGTIFLDEIGDMSARAQAKVLRVLEVGEVEPVGAARVRQVAVRVLAATNRDLTAWIKEGRFREDLYFRLNVVPVRTPPLRERTEDIPELVEHFTRLFSERDHRKPRRFAPSALEVLQARSWPGNVRELRNLIERVLIMTDADPIEARDLPPEARVSPAEISEKSVVPGDALGVQGVRRAAVPGGQAARERLEHQPHGRGDPDAAVEPLQEDRAPQDHQGERRVRE